MQRFVRVLGTVLGLLWSAYGAAVVTGMSVWPVVYHTECQFNDSLKLLLGEVAASRLIGALWLACGLAFVSLGGADWCQCWRDWRWRSMQLGRTGCNSLRRGWWPFWSHYRRMHWGRRRAKGGAMGWRELVPGGW